METLNPQTLIDGMAMILKTDAATLLGKDRTQPLPTARFILGATFCGGLMGMTTSEAGRHLGGRDHATVLHGIGVVALIRQHFGTPEEQKLLQAWDEYMDTIKAQLDKDDNNENTDMDINTIKYRGRSTETTWEHGQQIAISDGVITINGRWVKPDTLGMFTGLLGTDGYNGKLKREIYDGDIVKRKGVTGHYLVRFDQKHAAFRLVPTIIDGPKDGLPAYMKATECYTVLGNIHDNPGMGLAYSETYVDVQDRKTAQP